MKLTDFESMVAMRIANGHDPYAGVRGVGSRATTQALRRLSGKGAIEPDKYGKTWRLTDAGRAAVEAERAKVMADPKARQCIEVMQRPGFAEALKAPIEHIDPDFWKRRAVRYRDALDRIVKEPCPWGEGECVPECPREIAREALAEDT